MAATPKTNSTRKEPPLSHQIPPTTSPSTTLPSTRTRTPSGARTSRTCSAVGAGCPRPARSARCRTWTVDRVVEVEMAVRAARYGAGFGRSSWKSVTMMR
uniref:(northern house mosquito) hypothetical protein n=1 Tax=Culex pipiens TaxID=7175 RepID=A0A8D8LC24_CULPI